MKKKLLILIPALIIGFLIALNINVCINSLKYDTYEIDLSDEVALQEVRINNAKIPLKRYCNSTSEIVEEVIIKDEYEENITVLYSKETISIMISKIDDILIKVYGNSDKCVLTKNGEKLEFTDNLFENYINRIEVLKTGFNSNLIWMFLIALIVSYFILYYLIHFIEKFKDNSVKFYEILLFILGVFVIYLLSFYFMMYILQGFFAIVLIGICGYIVFYYRKRIEENIEKMYLVIGTIIGIAFIFLIPPFHVPDEPAHFIKSYDYFSYLTKTENKGYCKLATSLNNFRYKYESGSMQYEINYNPKSYFSDYFERGDYDKVDENLISYNNTVALPVVPYIPSIISVGILKLFNVSPLMLLLFARFSNCIVMIILCYYAIKNIPKYKKVLFLVSLLPMFLQQGMGLNLDWLTNTLSIVAVSYIFNLKEKEGKVTLKNIILLFTIAIALGFCKYGYFILVILAILIPNDKFKNKKIAILIKVLVFLAPLVLGFIANTKTIGTASDETSKYITFKYALENIPEIIKMYFNTFISRGILDLYRGGFDGFGVSTKWLSEMLQFITSTIYIILIACAGNGEKKTTIKERLLFFISALGIIFVVYSSLLFLWTKVGATSIDGLQHRYFIVASLLIYLGISNDKIKLNVKNRNLVYVIGVLVVHLISLLTLIIKFH